MRRILAIFLILLTLFLSSCAEKTLPVPKTEDSGKEKPVEAEKENLSSETETASESEKISTSSTTVTTTTRAPTTTTQAPVVTTKPEVTEPPLNFVFPKILPEENVASYNNSARLKLKNNMYLGVGRRMDFCEEFIAAFDASDFNEKYMIPNGYEMKIMYTREENPKYPEFSPGLRIVYRIKFGYTEGQKEIIKSNFDQWIYVNKKNFSNILNKINYALSMPKEKLAFIAVWVLPEDGSEKFAVSTFWDDTYVSQIVEPYA